MFVPRKWPVWRGVGIAFLLGSTLSLVNACSKDHSPEDPHTACRSSCEINDWPRAIVGIIPPAEFRGDETTFIRSINAKTPDGQTLTPARHGCPKATTIVCSFSVSTAPKDRSLEIAAELADGGRLEWSMPLAGHNHCAQQIAYVTVNLETKTAPVVSAVRYVSPCSNLSDN